MILKQEAVFFTLIFAFAIAMSIFSFTLDSSEPLDNFVRLMAINGFISISIAAIITPFVKELTIAFKKPFTRIHHYFAAAGLLLITLHPTAVTIQTMNPAILLPNLQSIELFFTLGGSIALIAIYVALGAVLLRRKIVAHWRPFHMLMYLALFFGIVHANLLGMDFYQSFAFAIIFDVLFAVAIFAFALKRWQFYKLRAKARSVARQKQSGSASAAT